MQEGKYFWLTANKDKSAEVNAQEAVQKVTEEENKDNLSSTKTREAKPKPTKKMPKPKKNPPHQQ